MAVIWNMSGKNVSFELETSNQCFFLLILLASRTCSLFFFFSFFFFEFLLVSGINHYQINELHLF